MSPDRWEHFQSCIRAKSLNLRLDALWVGDEVLRIRLEILVSDAGSPIRSCIIQGGSKVGCVGGLFDASPRPRSESTAANERGARSTWWSGAPAHAS